MKICKNILFLNLKNLSIIKGKKRKEKITCQFPKYIGIDNNKRCIINLMLYKIFKGYILLLLCVIIILKNEYIYEDSYIKLLSQYNHIFTRILSEINLKGEHNGKRKNSNINTGMNRSHIKTKNMDNTNIKSSDMNNINANATSSNNIMLNNFPKFNEIENNNKNDIHNNIFYSFYNNKNDNNEINDGNNILSFNDYIWKKHVQMNKTNLNSDLDIITKKLESFTLNDYKQFGNTTINYDYCYDNRFSTSSKGDKSNNMNYERNDHFVEHQNVGVDEMTCGTTKGTDDLRHHNSNTTDYSGYNTDELDEETGDENCEAYKKIEKYKRYNRYKRNKERKRTSENTTNNKNISHRNDRMGNEKISHRNDRMGNKNISHRNDRMGNKNISHGNDRMGNKNISHGNDRMGNENISHCNNRSNIKNGLNDEDRQNKEHKINNVQKRNGFFKEHMAYESDDLFKKNGHPFNENSQKCYRCRKEKNHVRKHNEETNIKLKTEHKTYKESSYSSITNSDSNDSTNSSISELYSYRNRKIKNINEDKSFSEEQTTMNKYFKHNKQKDLGSSYHSQSLNGYDDYQDEKIFEKIPKKKNQNRNNISSKKMNTEIKVEEVKYNEIVFEEFEDEVLEDNLMNLKQYEYHRTLSEEKFYKMIDTLGDVLCNKDMLYIFNFINSFERKKYLIMQEDFNIYCEWYSSVNKIPVNVKQKYMIKIAFYQTKDYIDLESIFYYNFYSFINRTYVIHKQDFILKLNEIKTIWKNYRLEKMEYWKKYLSSKFKKYKRNEYIRRTYLKYSDLFFP
ncbi:exported protein (PHISTc) [Plasmodium reichenowi]|uniref:Exported protein (PHISTc) n=1 Tax=Plasmodium reichenowi TaxID=5854 RepID=A0A151LF89_PLARE|nr:exported protein (PHISTc) [Plasmodium reichenowi]KYN97618.1 exported protein (PHISTc) [Plasmodium reichenowi]